MAETVGMEVMLYLEVFYFVFCYYPSTLANSKVGDLSRVDLLMKAENGQPGLTLNSF